jgi:hypothetical protein
MKKNFLMVAVCAALVLSVSSCQPDEKTGAELLKEGSKKGWVLKSAVSTPAYTMLDGTKVTNLLKDYLRDCEVDDVMKFNENGSQVINPGKDKKTTNPEDECLELGERSLGNWSLSNDEKKFTSFFLPYYEQNLGQKGDVEVVTIAEKSFTVSVKINDGFNIVTWTLVYDKQ